MRKIQEKSRLTLVLLTNAHAEKLREAFKIKQNLIVLKDDGSGVSIITDNLAGNAGTYEDLGMVEVAYNVAY